MPELPEVEHAARSLGEQIVGRTIVAVTRLDWERMVETPAVDQFLDLIQGRVVRAAGRRAKWIVLTLDDGWSLALHLRMSGSLTVHGPAAEPDAYTHLVLLLDDGRQVFFHDTRKFGRARLLDAAGLAALDSAHGVEPLTDAFTPELLAALLRRYNARIKPLLLNGRLIAGIGNIYADEALWNAQIHPLRQSASLSDEEVARLHSGIRLALLQGLEHGGSTLRDYRNGYGVAGSNQNHFKVYGRAGAPCPRCGTPIEKIVVAQRGTHLCPYCQPIAVD
ncbi:MAG TPA: bifunctional DNA-formamidopyrimidine glycosylase/DNA-(apurinic or apyrimidinic site) lyase [Kouleothrix sp.]|uniref:bifunctional DNA-formamidopyrimidine glycosylase/DNA-(apurinic or apyrimidinic site) lyase n=1 Tax=Kouleothrix sp. TaxID=2779161 RepID=UPI002CF1A5F4|nr:bifunctional DNA-formamidopyrimidine glycosylase/DNA-(apurinic or apyrimidinic site) lyase [Kouleothrix sp.]HRC74406.1 bifunctional DNA-formamidopyrimidine glycosylase/DNA-(apurinic or apyrimidinic site) lyase [Kouleothrix sp.]